MAELAEQVEVATTSGPGPSCGSRDYHYIVANEGEGVEGVELGTYSDRGGSGGGGSSGSGSRGSGGSVELLLPKGGREAIATRY